MELTRDNYFCDEAQHQYLGASQIKAFMQCETAALAELDGKMVRKPSKALLMGSYVDAWASGDLRAFFDAHRDEIFTKRGEMRSDFIKCEEIIDRIRRDSTFMAYLDGEKQRIMTAELFGEPFKIMMDAYHPGGCIVDLKVMKDLAPVYKDGQRQDFISAWGYDIQGHIYQRVVEENTGEHLPFHLAVVTKEEEPEIQIIHIPDWKLNSAAGVVEHYAKRAGALKRGDAEPTRCERCAYCRKTRVLLGPIEYDDFLADMADL